MNSLISLENVSVRFPTPGIIGGKRSADSPALIRRLAYRPRATKNYSTALSHIWLTVREGERLAVIGPNGSGKSTLLRVMAGSIPHASGRITQFGNLAAILSAQTGFLPQATGIENIYMRGLVLGLSRKEIADRIPEIQDFAQLGEWLYQPVSMYSSGMTLRLAFGVSTAITPDILIMDEWIGAGDARFLTAAQGRLQTMVSGSRILVLASHNEKVIRNFCTRAVVLFQGAIVFGGSVPDAIAYYEELNEVLSARQADIRT